MRRRLGVREGAGVASPAAALIPADWVGLVHPGGDPGRTVSQPGAPRDRSHDLAAAARGGCGPAGSAGDAWPGRSSSALSGASVPDATPRASVIASLDAIVLEHVTPVASWLERPGCVIEPGKPCRGSGRCRQRGY